MIAEDLATKAGTPEERRAGLGGSDAAAALGLSKYRSPYELWCLKTGRTEPSPMTEPQLWGHLHEATICAEYERRTGNRIEEHQAVVRHAEHTWMMGHIDGRMKRRIMDAKSSRVFHGWGDPGTDEVPLDILIQQHHYLTIEADAEVCDVATLLAGSDFRLYHIHPDPEIAAALIEGEQEFWRYVETDTPPPPINVDDVVARWGRIAARGSAVAGDIELAAIEELRRIALARRELDDAEQAAKMVVLHALRDNEALMHPGGALLATWKLGKPTQGYVVQPKPAQRRFSLKGVPPRSRAAKEEATTDV